MKNLLLAFAFSLLATTFCIAQAVPNPTPTPDDDVVKISTNLIQIDVTVTDKKGKVITDLKPEEIEIYENGDRQKITNFSFVSSVKPTEEKPKETDKTAAPVPTSKLRPEQVRRTFALVVDDLTLSFESAYYTRRALKKFVDEQMQDGDLVAIVRTGAGIGALQQFTYDKRMLYAAIEKVKWNPMGSGGISVFAPIEPAPETGAGLSGQLDSGEDDTPSGAETLEDFRTSVFATGTLGALRYIVQGMGDLPGRKSVILFSDGFRIFERDNSTGRVFDFLKTLVDTANRSSVVFYTIDPRGLQFTGFTAADNTSGMNAQRMSDAMSERSEQLSATQDGLRYLARETGGFAVVNNNDINGGVRRVLEDQSYYLIGYDPDSDTFDPLKRKFNKLTVKVLRKGAEVRYRSGFFNVADRPASTNTVAVGTPLQQIQRALLSPFAVTGIDLRLNALFGNDAKTGSFVRSLLHIDASDIKFTDEADGSKKAVFDVIAVSFGDNGQPVDQIAKTYTLNAKPEAFKKISTEGFVYHFSFPVKKAGPYQYRVAIRDSQGGKVGSASQFVEVPNLKKSGLTLSSIVIENLSQQEYQRSLETLPQNIESDPMSDTALRRVKQGSILRYGFEIYNTKLNAEKRPQLQYKIRVFREGKLVLDGTQKPFELLGQTDMTHLKMAGAIALGTEMSPGDYILQVVVTDPLAKAKKQIATQTVQFEVVQ